MIRRCRRHDVVIGKEKSRAMSGKVYLPVVPYITLHYDPRCRRPRVIQPTPHHPHQVM